MFFGICVSLSTFAAREGRRRSCLIRAIERAADGLSGFSMSSLRVEVVASVIAGVAGTEWGSIRSGGWV